MSFAKVLEAVQEGMLLICHASFKKCKEEGRTPEEVITSLQKKLGPEGTLMMPTFSYCYLNHPRHSAWDKNETPGVLNGVLSETFRTFPGTLRSNNPTYSVAVSGKYASLLTEGSADNAGLGHGSSYENALKKGAHILLLNVRNNRNSMLHYAEIASGVPYNDIPFREAWGRNALTKEGEIVLIPEYPACSEEFSKFDQEFISMGFAQDLGGSMLINAQDMVKYICGRINVQKDVMLCNNSECECCSLRRARLKSMGLI